MLLLFKTGHDHPEDYTRLVLLVVGPVRSAFRLFLCVTQNIHQWFPCNVRYLASKWYSANAWDISSTPDDVSVSTRKEDERKFMDGSVHRASHTCCTGINATLYTMRRAVLTP